jgi:hypothetical protein
VGGGLQRASLHKTIDNRAPIHPPHPENNWWVETSIDFGLHIDLKSIKRPKKLLIASKPTRKNWASPQGWF